jgi:DNA-binding NtrC family response regulator
LLGGARILVVEDEAILALDLVSILKEAGAEIVGPCGTVKEALATVAGTTPVDAALLDVRIGHETVAPVPRLLARHGIPFVFYTGQIARDSTLNEWPECKIIVKPADAGLIVSAIADLLTGGLRNSVSSVERNAPGGVAPIGTVPLGRGVT